MSSDVLTEERRGNVAVLTLNRPSARNAMNASLAAATVAAIEAAQDAGAIVITGADPAFCAGLDLRNLGVATLAELPPFLRAAASSEVPIVAAVNGPAVTGGLELALAADFIVASERAAFADTHLRVGVYPGPVAVDLPRRVGPAWARQMSLTGDFVDAATALRIGLANEVVPHDQLLDRALTLAIAIAEQDPDMVRVLRQDWRATVGLPWTEAHALHREMATKVTFAHDADALASRRETVLARSRDQRGETTG
jgi:enoyl-CoA hydratase